MSGIVIGMVAAAMALCGWIVGASLIYCVLSNHLTLFVYPYDQWLDIAPFWSINFWTQLEVMTSAALAALPLISAGLFLFQRRWGRPLVYGKTNFANQEQMKVNNILSTRRPF